MGRGPVNFSQRTTRLAVAAGRRQWWRLDDIVRSRLFGSAQAYDTRIMEPLTGTRVAPARPAPDPARFAVNGRLALLSHDEAGSNSAVAAAARYYGLGVDDLTPGGRGHNRADVHREDHPMLAMSIEGLVSLPEDWLPKVRQQLSRGGTVLVNGVVGAAPLRSLLTGLGLQGDVGERPAAVPSITFEASRSDFSAELAGLSFDTSTEAPVLSVPAQGAALAYANVERPGGAVVIEVPVGEGRLVVSAGSQRLKGSLADAFAPDQVLSILPAMMLMRRVYGRRAWHAPMSLADLVIDDPALHNNRLGLDYPRVLRATESGDFHLTVATVPRELSLAEPDVLRLLAQHPERLSACYHGADHAGYEFYRSTSGVKRYRSRPLDDQRRAIRSAAERGRAFQRRTGHSLDRVMVFPHGLGPADLLPSLAEAGFLATCNWLDRYPLEAAAPDDYDLGLRPADVAWGGLPLLWRRRPVDTAGFALDLFLGRPAIAFGHRKNLPRAPDWPARLAARINELGIVRPVVWRGLEEIARHAYQQRLEDTTWRVLMTANEICLHNPDSEPRVYRVCRPQAPNGATLDSGLVSVAATDELVVTVMPGAGTVVRIVIPGASELPRPGGSAPRCTLPD